MNERAEPPKTPEEPRSGKGKPAPLPTSGVRGPDREFLPAALEILETPPPPAPVAFMLTICAVFLLALAWSFFGRLDVYAVAPGKVEVVGHAKVIEPLDAGRVIAIHVAEGARVKAGELLIELDPTEALADEKAASDAMYANLAEVERRHFAVAAVRSVKQKLDAKPEEDATASEISALESIAADADETIHWAASIPEFIRGRELAVLRADLDQLSDNLADLDKQMAQKRATRKRLDMSIGFQESLIQTLTQLVKTRQDAINLHVGTKINLYDATEQLQRSQSTLASDQGQLIETAAALSELQGQKSKVVAQFIADNMNRALEAARKADEARQSGAKAAARLARTKLYAPIDGVVQQLAVTTVGQVVTTGQQLMTISPRGGHLQVEALVPNIDIGFVRLGQEASVKVDAFPFTRFGVLHGKVSAIAPQAVDEQAAKRALANVTADANAANAPASSAPGQPDVFVFPVTIALDETTIKIGDAHIPIAPGMTATVEIKTQQRRVIDYLLSPLAKLSSEAFRER
ncbi:HlyD family type I secretion periplasmic adaptor subunit [Rhodoblastus acidophilus]|uniref:Membrane fusion protein (MFP) family protein n=1 Tax=Candidatus Rhodoblastus alkanivorans TaxID=2954117 RepID=A0ABS9ZAT7_9HYPH|nr:HlyD family type I secretion periplasmic adaptor subunit [Candidatus Rhodoblastus alkanivorans]MCI4677178.1 HlyD family type I secretion periplasmic adaptor subunit [Candidatus Rhodoblastus alkanivorans]MCI4684531.1 HlyD family type I secretion periplasmic adaptor subunit [Candidatus Rhodoblastus alkanivorans]MDI4641852.1 HlyD family type I secretion periplasmic adaptor subunit [Rhodoblastus acidophilus]